MGRCLPVAISTKLELDKGVDEGAGGGEEGRDAQEGEGRGGGEGEAEYGEGHGCCSGGKSVEDFTAKELLSVQSSPKYSRFGKRRSNVRNHDQK